MSLHEELLPDPLPGEPLQLAADWLAAALAARKQPNPEAMVLATADTDGRPAARVVLCKGIDPHAGCARFVSNYQSRKGRELAANPRAAAVFFWDAMQRQLRLEGPVVRASQQESDAYFASRPWQSRLGAWASEQSAPLASRAALVGQMRATAQRFGIHWPATAASPPPDQPIPRPPHWGVYRLCIDAVEVWVAGAARLHDRARWMRTLTGNGDAYAGGPWSATRLNP